MKLQTIQALQDHFPPALPEQLLWWTVLERALNDVLFYQALAENCRTCATFTNAKSARKWIFSDATEPFSFLWCLEYMPKDSRYSRMLIRARAGGEIPFFVSH